MLVFVRLSDMTGKKKEQVSPARRIAFDILRRVETESSYASVLLASLPPELSSRDRALMREIVMGVLRWRSALDYFVERYSGRTIARLDLPVVLALRIGLYQIRYLSGIRDAAAVDESVKLVRRGGATSAAGMVNAVLRRAVRKRDDRPGEGLMDSMDRLSVELSHPRWLLERWIRALGEEEAKALARANNRTPSLSFRVNTLRTAEDRAVSELARRGFVIERSTIAPGAYRVEEGEASVLVEMADRGQVYIQDEASQLIGHLVEPDPGELILDLCAAPGSKATQMAALTGDQAFTVAGDLHVHRLAALRELCARLGVESVYGVALDGTSPLPFGKGVEFARILIDAPCTGTGTLRRNPEIKWRLAAGDPERMSASQREMLLQAASCLRRGGRLVYSTCSIEVEENESVIEWFISSNQEFTVVEPRAPADTLTADGFVRTYPHRHGCDGFFAAVLERMV